MGYGQGKLAHFRRVKLAHLFSMKKKFQKSNQYFIAFSDNSSHILSPKQKILIQKRIHGYRNLYICKSYYKPFYRILHAGQLTPSCGPTYPDAGQVGPCLPPLLKSQFCENYGCFICFSWQKHEQKC